jgi:uncharacterized MAPEG superfamily protein
MLHNFPVLSYLLASVLLYWVMLLFASLYHAKGWTWPGMMLAVGNRDKMPERTLMMARADRAAKNMAENLLIFAIVTLTAVIVGAPRDTTLLGGQIFFAARVIYWPLYLSGVKYARTLIWAIGLGGISIIASTLF